jgi:MFS family permease
MTGQLFYGWYVVYAVGLVLMTTSGLAFYNLSVLLDAFVVERGFPVALVSGATASFFIGSGAGGVLAARLIDRFDARIVMIAGACVSALALGSIGLLHRAWQLYSFHIVFGFCYGACGLVPATTVVTRWFEARRSLALSVASTGMSLGGVFLAPLSAYLLQKLGIAAAAPWLGAMFILGVVPVTALVIRSTPQELGLVPENGRAVLPGRSPAPPARSYAQARRSRLFIAVTAGYCLGLGAQVGAITHLFRLVSMRESVPAAAAAMAVMAGVSIIGRLTGGWALLRLPTRGFALAMLAGQGVSVAMLSIAAGAWLLLAAALFGVTVGNVLMLQALLIAEAFGTRHYGRLYSLSFLISGLGVAAAPALVGVIYAATGGYEVPYASLAALSAASCIILASAGKADARAES